MAETWKEFVQKISIEVDPNDIEKTLKQLQEQVKKLANDGRHTKVRIKYKGVQVVPDIPLAVFVAAELASALYLGPLRLFLVNLGVKSFLEIELIHDVATKVAEGLALYSEGDLDAAEKCFRSALELQDHDPYANYHLGILLRVQGRKKEARFHLRIAADTPEFEFAQKAQDIVDKMDGVVRSI